MHHVVVHPPHNHTQNRTFVIFAARSLPAPCAALATPLPAPRAALAAPLAALCAALAASSTASRVGASRRRYRQDSSIRLPSIRTHYKIQTTLIPWPRLSPCLRPTSRGPPGTSVRSSSTLLARSTYPPRSGSRVSWGLRSGILSHTRLVISSRPTMAASLARPRDGGLRKRRRSVNLVLRPKCSRSSVRTRVVVIFGLLAWFAFAVGSSLYCFV